VQSLLIAPSGSERRLVGKPDITPQQQSQLRSRRASKTAISVTCLPSIGCQSNLLKTGYSRRNLDFYM
jgi:hypothetical protein